MMGRIVLRVSPSGSLRDLADRSVVVNNMFVLGRGHESAS